MRDRRATLRRVTVGAAGGRAAGLALAMACLIAGCSRPATEAPAAESLDAPPRARRLTDDTGATVDVPLRPLRVACLAPDLTEMAFAVGGGSRIVGACDPCDYPPEAARLPRLGPMVAPSVEAILLLRPDLVLATAEGNPLDIVQRLRELGVPVFGLKPEPGLRGVATLLRRVGELLGEAEAEAAGLLARDMEARVEAARARVAGRPRVRACVLVWTEPLIAAGRDSYLTEVADAAGADNACATADGWPRLSREDVLLARPEVVLLATGEASSGLGEWASSTPAVMNGAVIHLPERPFLRPTAELGRAADELETLLVGATRRRP